MSSLAFGLEFQARLIQLLCEDPRFSAAVRPHLKASFFGNDILAWAFKHIVKYEAEYSAPPKPAVLMDLVRFVDPSAQALYAATLEPKGDTSADAWIKDQVWEFIERSLFVAAFHQCRDHYNADRTVEAYDLMRRRLDEIRAVRESTNVDRSFFFEDLNTRQARRFRTDPLSEAIPTGFRTLDDIMRGGLSPGELGIWVAYAKHGKSTMLIQHGVAAVRLGWKNVLHIALEGMRKLHEDRYEAAFANYAYSAVREGEFDAVQFALMQQDYQMFGRRLVLRGMLDRWTYTIEDVWNEIQTLERDFNWRPDLVIVDYGDLVKGRAARYVNKTAEQTDVFRDLKLIANRGYAVWTASQAQRPEKGSDERPHVVTSAMIADAYEKIRVADFTGSVNFTTQERQAGLARLYVQEYRDNVAGQVINVRTDWDKMILREDPTATLTGAAAGPVLGYRVVQHARA